MTIRSHSSTRLHLLLALGIAAAIPAVGAWAQSLDPAPTQEKAGADAQTPPAAEEAERKIDEARAKARRAREAELKAVAERIRQKREAIEDEAAREKIKAEDGRITADRELGQLEAKAANNLAESLILETRIETIRDALKAVLKRIMEAELQHELHRDSPLSDREVDSVNILRKQAAVYENQLRDCAARKFLLERESKDIQSQLNHARVQRDRGLSRGLTSTRSVARSVDRLLDQLSEEGAIDDGDHGRLNDAVGALEELIDIFREYHRGGGDEPKLDQAQPRTVEP